MRVLQATTYTLDVPRHGGQIRCSKIRSLLIDSGVVVDNICIIRDGETTNLGWNINVEAGFESRWVSPGAEDLLSDFAMGKELETPLLQAKLESLISSEIYDFVFVEQPWMFRGLWEFFLNKNSDSNQVKFVYSSQNVESDLKRRMLSMKKGLEKKHISDMISQVEDAENFAIRNAHLVVAVTEQDQDYFESKGAKQTLLAPNASREPLKRTNREVKPFGLFVGSAHLPNLEGFIDIFEGDLLFLPPDWFIVCVGGVCGLVNKAFSDGKINRSSVSRIKLLWDITDDELDELLGEAAFVVLPILDGGGSNLKTAEALAFGKAIFSTPTAMRGFEHWVSSDGVTISDNSKMMKKAISKFIEALGESTVNFPRESSLETPLYWDDSLSGLKRIISEQPN